MHHPPRTQNLSIVSFEPQSKIPHKLSYTADGSTLPKPRTKMKTTLACLVLLMSGAYALKVKEAAVYQNETDLTLSPQSNRNGWVNPEDLPPMPQCIAQQDQSAWLRAMTECTKQRCTSHFIGICTHHQWLTQLSCLATKISPGVIERYYPYCARSILAKAQLYQWAHTITGRTWLIEVGDAIGLQDLSPSSLVRGYTGVDVIRKAPTCLAESTSASSNEHFEHVMASCGFTGTTKHTGNAERPWEYSRSSKSMAALDYETAGYDLVLHYYNYLWSRIADGDYFDRDCFCTTYTLNLDKEPCAASGELEITKERHWIHATCGATSLSPHWLDNLKTTPRAFIPIEDWHWPKCVAGMPSQVTELTDICATDACEVDSSGYCRVRRAIDRACVCRKISYDSCGDSCHEFDKRIEYTTWLHGLCGDVQGWHGLPDNWRDLATPTPAEMIPWRWSLKPSNGSDTGHRPPLTTEQCASNWWKLGSLALVNIGTFLAAYLSRRQRPPGIISGLLPHMHALGWLQRGALIAALQVLATWVNSFIVQSTPGYEHAPALQLTLLWSSIPRVAWLTMLLVVPSLPEPTGSSAIATVLAAEVILQSISSHYMVMTIGYGWDHDFYFGALEGVNRGMLAVIMYVGALISLCAYGAALVHSVQLRRKIAEPGSRSPRSRGEKAEQTLFTGHTAGDRATYGTFSSKRPQDQVSDRSSPSSYLTTVNILLLLWISQWIFWGGFIGLSSEEFCPPNLLLLTAVWITASWMGVDILRL
ncbi:hypothetical protein BJX64DRAFT_264418 [Aspergillus heterothallicus]